MMLLPRSSVVILPPIFGVGISGCLYGDSVDDNLLSVLACDHPGIGIKVIPPLSIDRVVIIILDSTQQIL
jgi:hypothetical protein